jgi:hypothetical protein
MKRISFFAAFFLIVDLLSGESRPFPQNVTYSNGYKTSVISPDELYLLFSSSRPSLDEDTYLFISFRKVDGTRTIPEKINDAINSSSNARFPSISPDGKYLFFCGDDGNIYGVDINTLNKLNPTLVKKSETQPNGLQLYQNYPNLFNPSTLINYQQQVSGFISHRQFPSWPVFPV